MSPELVTFWRVAQAIVPISTLEGAPSKLRLGGDFSSPGRICMVGKMPAGSRRRAVSVRRKKQIPHR
ncbi:MAG: hypothetical protein WBM11_10255 [Terriglobales bacterium]